MPLNHCSGYHLNLDRDELHGAVLKQWQLARLWICRSFLTCGSIFGIMQS
jgi:hypothetical protein